MADLTSRYAFAYFTPVIVRVSRSSGIHRHTMLTNLLGHGLQCWRCQSPLSTSSTLCSHLRIHFCLAGRQVPQASAFDRRPGNHLHHWPHDNCIPQQQCRAILWNFPRQRWMPGKHPSCSGIPIEQYSQSIQEVRRLRTANWLRSSRWRDSFNHLPRTGRAEICTWALDDCWLAASDSSTLGSLHICLLAGQQESGARNTSGAYRRA